MKNYRAIEVVVFAILLSFGSQVFGQEHQHEEGSSQEMHGFSEKDLEAINKVLNTLENNYEAGDLDAVMATFADKAVLLEGRGINDGKKAIHDDHLAGEFKSMTFPVFRSKNRVVRGSGNIAYAYEILSVQIKRNSSEEVPPARDRRALYIVERQPDNTWKIVLMRI